MSVRTETDGSAEADASTIEISRSGPERYRYTCPRGHSDWDRTNLHVWCRGCRRQADHGDDVDPEWWEILDQKRDETIPWGNVEIVDA